MLQSSSEFCTKLLYGSIGVGVTLEIGDVAALPFFSVQAGLGAGQLGGDVSGLGKGPGSVAEEAAPGIQGAVPVGAAAAGGEGELVDLAAEAAAQLLIETVIVQGVSLLPVKWLSPPGSWCSPW